MIAQPKWAPSKPIDGSAPPIVTGRVGRSTGGVAKHEPRAGLLREREATCTRDHRRIRCAGERPRMDVA